MIKEATVEIRNSSDPCLEEIDSALQADLQKRQRVVDSTVKDQKRSTGRLEALPRLLRTLGALVLIVAAATFMLQGWGESNHLIRYGSFLIFTLVLAGAGFFCGLRMGEDKGARTFLAVAAAIIPVHFCQLGGLILSQLAPAGWSFAQHPAYALWVAPDLATALIITAVGTGALIFVALIAFSSLVRAESKQVTAVYLFANAVMLIPTRDPNIIAAMGFCMALGLAYFDSQCLRTSVMRTLEGKFVRVMLFVPFLVLVGRTLHLYNTSAFFIAMLFGIAAVLLFAFSPVYATNKKHAVAYQGLSVIPAGIAWGTLAVELISQLHAPDYLYLPILCLPFAGLLIVMSMYTLSSGAAYRRSGVLLAIITGIVQMMLFPGVISALFSVALGIAAVGYGFTVQQRTVLIFGVIGVVVGLFYNVKLAAMELVAVSPWISLAVIGIVTILASSYLERHFSKIVEVVGTFRNNMKEWN
ncbi:hypothetical protein OAO01_04570 [Oligoflexia bacterium]|nr:hypothetical protein [Oligoflexia bacterium]